MTVPYVVHLSSAELDRGALAGRVTDVDTGVVRGFRSAEELVAFLLGAGQERGRALLSEQPSRETGA